MFFISAGLVEVVSTRTGDNAITLLGSQSFFGEMALLNPTGETTASVVVRTYMEGFLLTKSDYAWLERHHPAFREYLLSAARLRLQKMQVEKGDAASDERMEALFEVLDPTRRKLMHKVRQSYRGALTPKGGAEGKRARRGTIWTNALNQIYKPQRSHEQSAANNDNDDDDDEAESNPTPAPFRPSRPQPSNKRRSIRNSITALVGFRPHAVASGAPPQQPTPAPIAV